MAQGVAVVWLVLPDVHVVCVVTAAGMVRLGRGAVIPVHPLLPELTLTVAELFTQIDRVRR